MGGASSVAGASQPKPLEVSGSSLGSKQGSKLGLEPRQQAQFGLSSSSRFQSFTQPRNLRACGSEKRRSSSAYILGHEVKMCDLPFGAGVARRPTSPPFASPEEIFLSRTQEVQAGMKWREKRGNGESEGASGEGSRWR